MKDGAIRIEAASYAVAGGREILSGIDLHLTEARIGIVGRNGSGKTTLLRLMAGLIAPVQGRVTVGGADPGDRRAMLAKVGILFQNPDHQILFPTVEEELGFGLRQMGRTKGEVAATVAARLTAEGRAHWAGLSTQALSHGQKQYLCLLAVLMMGPATILLDEPFAALDVPTKLRLSRRLAELPQRLVIISHDPATVSGCDRVIWLEGGRVAADGTPTEVLPRFEAEMARLGVQDDANCGDGTGAAFFLGPADTAAVRSGSC
ncbi:MAG: cobalt ABC transporter [Cereibacter sphaeroides]|uniref:Cobalt ABC transporter n=1 Tax=Cereibacter sphaeroides TaxID=1063 RepID=A0A2W5SMF5_CERSP|nr:MAG: cobalt ABC transporter [Cereibacter sphaeroides]